MASPFLAYERARLLGRNWQFARCSRTPPVVGNGATGYCLMFYGKDNVPTNFSKRSAIICGSRAHLLWSSRSGYFSIVTSALGKPAARCSAALRVQSWSVWKRVSNTGIVTPFLASS